MTKAIKGISEELWIEFKEISRINKTSMPKTFEMLLRSYKKESKEFWKSITKGKKILSDDEAEEMIEVVKELRKERGFRV